MCLLVFAWRVHPRFTLALAGNRDEFHDRPARAGLRRLVDDDRIEPDALFELLSDRRPAPEEELPHTGVPLEWERLLSSAFIVDPRYGTRASTVVLVGAAGRHEFEERRFDQDGEVEGEYCFRDSGSS